MDEKEYNTLCESFFGELEGYLESLDGDFDFDNNGQICEIALDDGRKIVVSRQPPLREIWLADRSGGFHFRREGDDWIDTKSGESFRERLDACLGIATGQ